MEVVGNTVSGNADGIGLIEQHRGVGRFGRYRTANDWVHHNDVEMTGGQTGLVQDLGDHKVFTERNDRFRDDRYCLANAGDTYFAWDDRDLTPAQWRAEGQDRGGSFHSCSIRSGALGRTRIRSS